MMPSAPRQTGAADDYRAVVVSSGWKRRLELWGKALARSVGLDIARAKLPLPDRRRRQLMLRCGVDLVIDVGANAGQYAERLRASGYTGRIVSFEPLSQAFAELSRNAAADPAWDCLNVALGDADTTATIHVSADSFSSSLLSATPVLEQSAPQAVQLRDESVNVCTLASQASRIQLPEHTSLLKMDVQGFERQVLEGARRVLDRVPLVELELSVREMYRGQDLYLDVLSLLGDMGYVPAVIWEEFVDRATGRLNQFNVIAERQ